MIPRKPHRLHHRFGARHVERHLVQPGDLADSFDVIGDDRMVGAQHWPKIAHPLRTACDARLVEIITEKIDAVGVGNVVQDIAVGIADRDAIGRLQDGTRGQVLTHVAAELEGNPIGGRELKVGSAAPELGSQRTGPCKPLAIDRGKPHKAIAPSDRDVLRRIVRTEEPMFVVLIEWHQRCDQSCETSVSRKRPVLRSRQFYASLEFEDRKTEHRRTGGIGCEHRHFHRRRIAPSGKMPIS